MFSITKIRHPGFRCSEQEGQGHQRRTERQCPSKQTGASRDRVGKHKQTDQNFYKTQSGGKDVGVICGLPNALVCIQFTLVREVCLVILGMFVKNDMNGLLATNGVMLSAS